MNPVKNILIIVEHDARVDLHKQGCLRYFPQAGMLALL